MAHSFVHRAEADLLREEVASGEVSASTYVLSGSGGVGKTQLAAEYVRRAWSSGEGAEGLDVLVWVTASSRVAIVDRFAQAGIELCRARPGDSEKAAQTFLAWLTPKSGSESCRWLVVLDDLADPDDLRGLWPPDSSHGRTLVTTRRRDAALLGRGRRLVEVGLFSDDEARSFLRAAMTAYGRSEADEALAALAADLGCLPLALSQAVAYLADTGASIADYRTMLADHATSLVCAAPRVLPDDQDRPLAAAWALSMERADAMHPVGLARPVLQLAAVLDGNGIPETVLTSASALAHLAAQRSDGGVQNRGERPPVSDQSVQEALHTLHRLSLIDYSSSTPHQAVRVHQLVQRATLEPLTEAEHDEAARAAADALVSAWPDAGLDAASGHALRANSGVLVARAEDALYAERAHEVLFRAGRSLGDAGQAESARAHFQHVADMALCCFGPAHPDTLAAQRLLAQYHGEAGDAAGAVTALSELLDDCLRMKGPDHLETIRTAGELARWRGEAGNADGAVTATVKVLDDCLRVLGPDHADTLAARNNLARWRAQTGNPSGAASALADLLDDCLRVLGPHHPHTLSTRHNLASMTAQAGDAAKATAAWDELLADHLRVLGPDHPRSLQVRGELANLAGETGNVPRATAALVELLDDCVRALGPDHPQTLAVRTGLAYWKYRDGDAAGAAFLLAEQLDHEMRILGPDHPEVLSIRHDLAAAQVDAGDVDAATVTVVEVLADRLRTLGPEHPDTLATRHNLAVIRGRRGDTAGAESALAHLLPDRVRVLGPDHPDTLATRYSLAVMQGRQGKAATAAAALADLLPDRARVLGLDHPDTQATRDSLAEWSDRAQRTG
ncbi:tetratricopeptide repeat protein [Streptomyces rochei]|uniref:tetratricopeptide repeat protein n=1 Tax=Streptomyces rochei TaxID=1928 RepID=UPI003697A1CC